MIIPIEAIPGIGSSPIVEPAGGAGFTSLSTMMGGGMPAMPSMGTFQVGELDEPNFANPATGPSFSGSNPLGTSPTSLDFGGMVKSFQTGASQLNKAQNAEAAFASGHGNLQDMIIERAKADVFLQVASSAASKTTSAISTILNMQM